MQNNGGGFVNHKLFWEIMAPGGSDSPTEEMSGLLNDSFGSFDQFKQVFSGAAATQFGSGWSWLVVDPDGGLQVMATANQNSPLSCGCVPILGVDVWEHAYYLNYQNRRPDYLSAFWNVVNWTAVSEKYLQTK